MADPTPHSGQLFYDLRAYAPIEDIISACRRAGAVTPSSFGSKEVFHVRVHEGGLASLSPTGMTYSWSEEELRRYWVAHLL